MEWRAEIEAQCVHVGCGHEGMCVCVRVCACVCACVGGCIVAWEIVGGRGRGECECE